MFKYTVLAVSALLAGCVSSRPMDVAKPSELTVQAAMRDVAEGLQEFRQIGMQNKASYGLLVDEVTLTLKVTASAKDGNKLVVNVADIKPAFLAPAVLGGSYTADSSSDATRDNTIVIKLKNVYTAQLNARGVGTGLKKGPNGIVKSDEGVELFSAPIKVDCKAPKPGLEKILCDSRQ